MQCDICNKKKATVHLTEIVDEQMSEMHLCEDCAREKSVQMEKFELQLNHVQRALQRLRGGASELA